MHISRFASVEMTLELFINEPKKSLNVEESLHNLRNACLEWTRLFILKAVSDGTILGLVLCTEMSLYGQNCVRAWLALSKAINVNGAHDVFFGNWTGSAWVALKGNARRAWCTVKCGRSGFAFSVGSGMLIC